MVNASVKQIPLHYANSAFILDKNSFQIGCFKIIFISDTAWFLLYFYIDKYLKYKKKKKGKYVQNSVN